MNTGKANKIRILYLVSRLRRVGPVFQLHSIVKNLERDRFEPQVITLSPEGQDSIIDRFRALGVECKTVGLSSIAGLVWGAPRIKKMLQENPADLIHAADYRSILLSAIRFAPLPRIATCRQVFDYSHYSLDGTLDPISARVMVMTLKKACKKCERVVGVSDFVRHSAGKRLAERMTVIYNGVDQDVFGPGDAQEKAALRSRLNLPPEEHIFLTVGFLSRRKDPLTVLRAFLQSRAPRTAILVMLGDGPLRETCLRLANANNSIRVVGFVRNVRDYLGAADTFVSASLTEGCPNAVMEALACGLPVVLSDIPPHREILAFNEQAGQVFPLRNEAALSDILSERAGMGCSEPSGAALSIIENHLNARKMSLEYQALYAGLCG
jgi:glycosyltransferase involved in cell wall biosynthesis